MQKAPLGVLSTIRLGIAYQDIFPDDPALNPIFIEFRVKRVLNLAKYLLPPFIVLMLVWSFYLGGGFKGIELFFALKSNWPMTLFCVLFVSLMPVQGYYFMGKRAQMPLNQKQRNFYIKYAALFNYPAVTEPTMMDLAGLINEGIKQQGRSFLKEL